MALGAVIALGAPLIPIRDDQAGASRLFYAQIRAVGSTAPALERLAGTDAWREVEVVVQLRPGSATGEGRRLVEAAGGHVTRELPIISGLGAEMEAGRAAALAGEPAVRAVSLNGRVESSLKGGLAANRLKTAYNQSIGATALWFKNDGQTGKGVGVAVLDTGIEGGLVDFRASEQDSRSRVVASAVVNPGATSAGDSYGHGTHVAGLIAGNGAYRTGKDKLDARYAGVAPDAHLVSVKVSDEQGGASVLDVIDGLQFVLDHKDRFNIRVVNLSLNSTVAESYKTDPLDAAVEAAWFRGLVVVAAAGNRGAEAGAVDYAPANDPYAITVGGVDDRGTKDPGDDKLAAWSSRGKTQDGFKKPEVLAPGAHLASTLAPASEFARECPTCVTDGEYLQVGGTSMAAGVVSGAVALILQEHPKWTPDQVKGALVHKLRDVPGTGGEVAVENARGASGDDLLANRGLTPSTYIDPATGGVDLTRARWSRARWSDATELLRARWSSASFSCASCGRDMSSSVEQSRARWSRARWSTSYSK
jgi:serine protease AprX